MSALYDKNRADEAERENTRLKGIIADAIAALDEGRRGDVRRILTTGRADPVKSGSCVIAKDAR